MLLATLPSSDKKCTAKLRGREQLCPPWKVGVALHRWLTLASAMAAAQRAAESSSLRPAGGGRLRRCTRLGSTSKRPPEEGGGEDGTWEQRKKTSLINGRN